ncbi:MAG: hypothetical protein K6G44_18230 [Lentisphaeria bacterium]|nr:hypothetical protein [Lentisphaeria bacterium]
MGEVSAFSAAKPTDINAHITHGKYDINVRTAQRWQDHCRGCNPRQFNPKGVTSSRIDIARSATQS